MKRRTLLKFSAAAAVLPALSLRALADTKDLVHEAYIYTYPMVKNYLSMYQYALEKDGSQYKAPLNELGSVARVFTDKDTGVITPNSDTPYSFIVMDLRAEPLVFTMPKVEPDRYYSLQIIDLYTHNVDYLGTRVDGNDGGDYLITGPGWKGEVPASIKRVIEVPTTLALGLVRTQLFDPADLEKVKEIQDGYKVQVLSAYSGTSAPPAAPTINWPSVSEQKIVTDFWPLANFLLQFAPPLPWESGLRKSFETIGLTGSNSWPPADLDEATVTAMRDMVAPAQAELFKQAQAIADSSTYFGTPEFMKGQYDKRAAAALGGIYGNTVQEALYVMFAKDADGELLDGSKHNYVIRFTEETLPPAKAFWSITMYDLARQFLVKNPLDRFLINSPMLADLKRNDKGEILLYLQKDSPGPDLESNWLPAPAEPFYAVARLYLPSAEALDGTWKAPVAEKLP